MKKIAVLLIVFVLALSCNAFAEKFGSVDLRRAFYEYEKSKTYDKELNDTTNERAEKRKEMVEDIRKMRDSAELLSDAAKLEKQKEIEAKIGELNEYDRVTRQELINKKNDMFREVIEEIQGVVNDIGKKEGYDFILDSRNIMYEKTGSDITDNVLAELNK